MNDDSKLVLRVNEVYHDLQGLDYASVHTGMFEAQTQRWQRIGAQLVAGRTAPLCIVDIGSGTGFVASRIAPLLQASDRLICADLSQKMLNACEQHLSSLKISCQRAFLKLDGKNIGMPDQSCDALTMNSVLHHIPEMAPFLSEVNRVLKPGGRLAFAHEPSRHFYESFVLRTHAAAAGMLFTPQRIVGAGLRRLGLMEAARSALRSAGRDSGDAKLLKQVNQQLLCEGVIREALTQDKLQSLVDVKSPTAGGFRPGFGIDIESLLCDLPGFEVESVETYNHLAEASLVNALARWYDGFLKRRNPGNGATLSAVLRKFSLSP